jgi:hypothetical protein
MSVLIEGISLILRRTEVDVRFPGGTAALFDAFEDAAVCADRHLIRLGFLDGERVDDVLTALEGHGFRIAEDNRFLDLAVVDQVLGLSLPCDWLEFDSAPGEPAYCWMKGEARGALVVPANWRYEHSLSRRFGRAASAPSEERYRWLRSEEGIEVYRDAESGQEVFFAVGDQRSETQAES